MSIWHAQLSKIKAFPLLQCAVDTLCGVALSQPMQQMLTVLTDYCTIAAECQVIIDTSLLAARLNCV